MTTPHRLHRIVGLLAFNGVFAESDLPTRQHYEAILFELASFGDGFPVWGPSGYGSFITKCSLVRRARAASESLDSMLRPMVDSALHNRTTEAILVLDTQFTPDEAELLEDGEDSRVVSVAASMVADTLRGLVYASNIARPASVSSASISVCVDRPNYVFEQHTLINDFWAAREYATRSGWPALEDLELVDTWMWVAENFLTVRAGDSPLSRAFNAYTYLYDVDIPGPLRLLTALIGVEALFGSGRPGIASQVVERAQLLLGQRGSFKADLRRMYEVRSAIVHGAVGFPPYQFPYADPPAYKRRRKDAELATDVAMAVLLATFQRCVKLRASHVEFHETLTTRNEKYDQGNSEELGIHFIRYRASDLDAYLDAHLVTAPPTPDENTA